MANGRQTRSSSKFISPHRFGNRLAVPAVALIYTDRPTVTSELVDRTLSNLASSFFEPAAKIEDMGSVLKTYPQAMPGFVGEQTTSDTILVGQFMRPGYESDALAFDFLQLLLPSNKRH